MRVAVIGCGPAGLFAAEACRQEGLEYVIYGPKTMSKIAGAQYLHKELPGLTGAPQGQIEYRKIGTRDGYAMKVYGNMKMDVSWDTFDEGAKPYWSLSDAYLLAWLRHEERINGKPVKAKDIANLETLFDLVINTAPKKAMCLKDHVFTDQLVYLSVPEQRHQNGPNQIVYNGQRDVDWYRWSFIQGNSCYEFSRKPTWKKKELLEIHKPLRNFCNCHEHYALHYLEVGRFGRWRKGALTHEAYYLTMERLDEML